MARRKKEIIIKKRLIIGLTIALVLGIATYTTYATTNDNYDFYNKNVQIGEFHESVGLYMKSRTGEFIPINLSNKDLILYDGTIYMNLGVIETYTHPPASGNTETSAPPTTSSPEQSVPVTSNPEQSQPSLPNQVISDIVLNMSDAHVYLTEAHSYLQDTSQNRENSLARVPLALQHAYTESDYVRPYADQFPEVQKFLGHFNEMYNTLLLIEKHNRTSDHQRFTTVSELAVQEILTLKSQQ